MVEMPFYAAYPWPLNEIYKFWDTVFARLVAHHAEAGIKLWFSPYMAMAQQAEFSDFGLGEQRAVA